MLGLSSWDVSSVYDRKKDSNQGLQGQIIGVGLGLALGLGLQFRFGVRFRVRVASESNYG